MKALEFEKAIIEWAGDINHWYHLNATPEEVKQALKAAYPDAGDSTFFRIDGKWREWLDTCEREGLADQVDRLRGIDPSLAYNQPGSFNRQ